MNKPASTNSFDSYVGKFTRDARIAGLGADAIASCIKYAENLHARRLPIIYDQQHLSLLVGVQYEYLLRAMNGPHRFYRDFYIQKKNGGRRHISEPLPILKEIQKWILENILSKLEPSPYAKAFVRGASIRENARFHLRQSIVLNIDIKDYFGSVRAGAVYKIFRNLGYTRAVASALTNICTLDGVLPQGAPTSPCISNIVSRRLDMRLSGYCKRRKIRYTRYADDLTFSGSFRAGILISFVERICSESGFSLNEKKTRAMPRHTSQEVTGIIVNQRIRAPKEYRRKLRQEMHFIKKFGLEGHMSKAGIEKANYLDHLYGKAKHILFLDPTDRDALAACEYVKNIRRYMGLQLQN